jgi:hypothetical protein
MVTATLASRVRAMLIGVLTILALTGTSTRVVRAVMHQQTPRRQVLAAPRVLPQPGERMVAVGDSITKGDWDVDEAGGWVTRLATKLRMAYPHATAWTVTSWRRTPSWSSSPSAPTISTLGCPARSLRSSSRPLSVACKPCRRPRS